MTRKSLYMFGTDAAIIGLNDHIAYASNNITFA